MAGEGSLCEEKKQEPDNSKDFASGCGVHLLRGRWKKGSQVLLWTAAKPAGTAPNQFFKEVQLLSLVLGLL